jgi:hypothetical protein
MTLEAAIQENTQVVRELIAALGAAAYRQQKAVEDEPDFATPPGTESHTLPEPPKAEANPEPVTEAKPAALTIDDVRAAALALVRTNRDALADILKQMGAAKATELPEDKWGEFIDRANEVAKGLAA